MNLKLLNKFIFKYNYLKCKLLHKKHFTYYSPYSITTNNYMLVCNKCNICHTFKVPKNIDIDKIVDVIMYTNGAWSRFKIDRELDILYNKQNTELLTKDIAVIKMPGYGPYKVNQNNIP